LQAPGTALPLIDGRFRLLKLLAVGGMGELYLATARDTEIEGLEQLVVMKRILPAYATDRDVVTMFMTEARIAARLDHPNVVQVYDMGRAGGSLYFTMEYLHGANLEQLFDAAKAYGGGFPIGQVLTIILGVCAGLHFAHEMRRVDGRPMGIVHRDVSPGNVFITFNGDIKLVDFGIAKVLSSSRTTQTGMLKGKLAYMSPEQVRGEPIDRRSDIFAIGILLFEMVTLSHLFDDDNEYDLMQKIAAGDVPRPSERRPGIAPELERIILKALAPVRNDRYATARDLADDLQVFAQQTGVKLSLRDLTASLTRLIGDQEYPWYLDEEGPDEAAAVRKWFASARPEDIVEDIDLEISLTDMLVDEDEPPEDEPEYQDEEYDEPTDAQDDHTVVYRQKTIGIHSLASLSKPPRPRLQLTRTERILLAVFLTLLAIVLLRCAFRKAPTPPPAKPPVTQTPAPEPEPEPPPPVAAPVVTPTPPPPAPVTPPEPATKSKPKAKKQPAK